MKEINNKYIINKRRLSDDKKRIEKTTIFFSGDGQKKTFFESVRLYNADELENMILESGFKKIKKYGSLCGERFTRHSERLVLVCEK